jgi:uncharacterized surface protein with fasciclin (FAS1) repeats
MKIRLALAGAAAAALVLTGCGTSSDSAEESPSPTAEATQGADTIVGVASDNPDFSTLVAAVQAADLVDTLNGEGPFTVFAPTNEAFEALPAGVLDALLLEENKDVLEDILTYHVVDGEVLSTDITAGPVATLQGAEVEITTDDGGVQVDGATVVQADVQASNGVIHVIDAVLIPEGVDPAALLQ